MFFPVAVGVFLSVPLITCICWQRKNLSSVKHGGSCLKLWHWQLKYHRLPQPVAVIYSSLQRPQEQQEQPKDRIPTTPHPAANWDLARAIYRLPGLQVILNPFYHGQEGQKAMLN